MQREICFSSLAAGSNDNSFIPWTQVNKWTWQSGLVLKYLQYDSMTSEVQLNTSGSDIF